MLNSSQQSSIKAKNIGFSLYMCVCIYILGSCWFFMKSNVLFSEISQKHVTESIVHYNPLLFPHLSGSNWIPCWKKRLLRLILSQPIFWHLHKNESAAQPDHLPLIGTSDNQMGQCLVNTVSGVGLPSISKWIFTCFAACGLTLSYCKITLLCLSSYNSHFFFNAQLKCINCSQ